MMIFKEIIFKSDDYQKTLELRTKILRAPLGKQLTKNDLEGEESQLHFGIFDSENLVACVVIKPVVKDIGKLRQMAVDNSVQGKGVGKFIIEKTEDILLTKGIHSIEMAARQTAIGFYQNLGYSKVGDPFLEQGIEHIKMFKLLLHSKFS